MSARFVTGGRDREDSGEKNDSSYGSWKSIKRRPKSGRPYVTSLTFAFALTAIMTALVLVVILAIAAVSSSKNKNKQQEKED